MIEWTTKHTPTDSELTEAIALRCSRVFPALNIANGIGGRETIAWQLVHQFSAIELLDEATERGIDLSAINSAVEGGPIPQTPIYAKYLEIKARRADGAPR